MPDREKVISDLEQQIRWIEEIECHKFPGWLSATNAMRDAIALLKEQNDAIEKADSMLKIAEDKIKELLKEQEAVEPVKQIEQTEWTVCGNCRNHIISRWKFCPYCGRSVKWE